MQSSWGTKELGIVGLQEKTQISLSIVSKGESGRQETGGLDYLNHGLPHRQSKKFLLFSQDNGGASINGKLQLFQTISPAENSRKLDKIKKENTST